MDAIIAFFLLLFPIHLFAATGEVEFISVSDLKAETVTVEGKGGKATGGEVKDGKLSGFFETEIKDFKTGIKLRDKHMCGFLKCEQFPKAHVEITEPVPTIGQHKINFKLSFIGVTKPLVGDYEGDGKKAKVKFVIPFRDFNPNLGFFSDATVKNEIPVTVNLDLTK